MSLGNYWCFGGYYCVHFQSISTIVSCVGQISILWGERASWCAALVAYAIQPFLLRRFSWTTLTMETAASSVTSAITHPNGVTSHNNLVFTALCPSCTWGDWRTLKNIRRRSNHFFKTKIRVRNFPENATGVVTAAPWYSVIFCSSRRERVYSILKWLSNPILKRPFQLRVGKQGPTKVYPWWGGRKRVHPAGRWGERYALKGGIVGGRTTYGSQPAQMKTRP